MMGYVSFLLQYGQTEYVDIAHVLEEPAGSVSPGECRRTVVQVHEPEATVGGEDSGIATLRTGVDVESTNCTSASDVENSDRVQNSVIGRVDGHQNGNVGIHHVQAVERGPINAVSVIVVSDADDVGSSCSVDVTLCIAKVGVTNRSPVVHVDSQVGDSRDQA